MKIFFFLFITFTITLTAQKKEITLQDIWTNGVFRTERLNSFQSLKKGDFYTILHLNGETKNTSLDKYDYRTLERVETIVDSKNLNEIPSFDNYEFSKDEDKLILGIDSERIYRRSSRSVYYVYEIASKKLQLISEKKIQEPTFSPDGNKVAYAYNNNIYIKDLINNGTIQVTFDGEKNKVINGITDWVYEEEFSFVRAFDWNGNSNKLAFLRFDETEVPEFSMDIYGKDLYPAQQVFKYPKAGEKKCNSNTAYVQFTD